MGILKLLPAVITHRAELNKKKMTYLAILLVAVVCVSGSPTKEKRDANPCGYGCPSFCAPACQPTCCMPPPPPPPPPQMVHHVTHVHHHTVHHQAPQAPAMPAVPMPAPPPTTVQSQQHVWEYVPPPPVCPPACVPAPVYYPPPPPPCPPPCASSCAPPCPPTCCKKRSS